MSGEQYPTFQDALELYRQGERATRLARGRVSSEEAESYRAGAAVLFAQSAAAVALATVRPDQFVFDGSARRGQTVARLVARWTEDPYATLVVVLEEAFNAGLEAAANSSEVAS